MILYGWSSEICWSVVVQTLQQQQRHQSTRMRLCLMSVLVLSLGSLCQGQSFLDNFMSIFSRLNPFRQTQQSSSSSSSAPVFRPRPSFSRPPTPSPFRRPPSPASFSAPVRPQVLPASLSQLRIEPIATPGRGNHNFEGRTYLASWKEGRSSFTWQQARDYCAEAGMRMVSLDSEAKREHFLTVVGMQGLEFMWTGGRISPDKSSLTWENGVTQSISRGVHPWSPAGLRGPQPDGRGSENCLAILNNVYNVSLLIIFR